MSDATSPGVVPEGWRLEPLKEIAALSLGKMVDKKQATGLHPTPYLRNVNIRWGSVDLGDLHSMDISPKELDRVSLRIGDVVVCEGGEPGRTTIWRSDETVAIQKALHRIQPSAQLNSDFLGLLLEREFRGVGSHPLFTGTTIKHLPKEKLGTLSVPVPPLPEQAKIVEILEEQLSHLDAALEAVRTVRVKANQFRRSLLHAAFTGALTGHDTSSGVLPDGWKQSTLEKVARWGSGGTPKSGTSSYYGGHIPWAVIGDLTESWVSETAKSITQSGLDNSSAKIVEQGTVMLAMYGASIGRTGIAATAMATNQAIAFAAPTDGTMNAQYLLKYLQSQKQAFVEAGQGGAQPNISQTVIRPWPILVPPLAEQEKIVEILEEQLSRLDASLAVADAVEKRTDALRRSLLHAAFTGNLTKEWRDNAHV